MKRLNLFQFKRPIVRFFTVLMVVGVCYLPEHAIVEPEVASATIPTIDWANIVQTTFTAIETGFQSGVQYSLNLKEFSLDAVAWGLINVVLEEMIKSTTQWVNSGFEGNPAFVTDLGGYMTKLGDKMAGNFIWGIESPDGSHPLQALCSPFSLDVKLALTAAYQQQSGGEGYVAECTLSEALNNAESIANGDFLNGGNGLDNFFDVAVRPENNAYGAFFQAEAALEVRIRNEKGEEHELLSWANGFFSGKDKQGRVINPGKVIESQLNEQLAGGQQRLTVADEFNELIGALLSQLAGQVFSSGGLSGLSTPDSDGQSYFDRMKDVRDQAGQIKVASTLFKDAISVETMYVSLQQQVISLINGAETTCGRLTDSLRSKRTTAQTGVTNANEVLTALRVYETEYNTLQSASSSRDAAVQTILTKYKATSIAEAQARLVEGYSGYQTSGKMHSSTDVTNLQARTLVDPGDDRNIWKTMRDNIRAEILLFTTDDPETRRIRESCLVPASSSSFTLPI